MTWTSKILTNWSCHDVYSSKNIHTKLYMHTLRNFKNDWPPRRRQELLYVLHVCAEDLGHVTAKNSPGPPGESRSGGLQGGRREEGPAKGDDDAGWRDRTLASGSPWKRWRGRWRHLKDANRWCVCVLVFVLPCWPMGDVDCGCRLFCFCLKGCWCGMRWWDSEFSDVFRSWLNFGLWCRLYVDSVISVAVPIVDDLRWPNTCNILRKRLNI